MFWFLVFLFCFFFLLHIVLNFSLKLCTTWWWPPLWPKHVVVSYLPPCSYIIITIFVFDYFIHSLIHRERYWNVNGDRVGVWCVPSATHTPWLHRSQNKVLDTKINDQWCVCEWYDGPVVHTHKHTHHWFKITPSNTDQAHDEHQWTTSNFSPVQLCTPWWWIAYDPKHVGVIFNFVYFKLLYNVDFNL